MQHLHPVREETRRQCTIIHWFIRSCIVLCCSEDKIIPQRAQPPVLWRCGCSLEIGNCSHWCPAGAWNLLGYHGINAFNASIAMIYVFCKISALLQRTQDRTPRFTQETLPLFSEAMAKVASRSRVQTHSHDILLDARWDLYLRWISRIRIIR